VELQALEPLCLQLVAVVLGIKTLTTFLLEVDITVVLAVVLELTDRRTQSLVATLFAVKATLDRLIQTALRLVQAVVVLVVELQQT
jgi:hypothetical protein